MVTLYVLINQALDLTIRPMEGLSPVIPLSVWSAIMGVAAMLIYKYTSKQDGIKDAKEKIKGHFYEVWLYIDDAAVLAMAQVHIMKNAFRYMGYAMPPLVIMVVLFFPLFANFETRYASKPVPVGQDVMVKLKLTGHFEGWESAVKLDLPKGVSMVGYPMRFIHKDFESDDSVRETGRDYEVDYKLRPEEAGEHELKFSVSGKDFDVPLRAGDDYGVRVPYYATRELGEALLFPPVVTIPSDVRVKSVEIKYPEAEFPFFGWNTWWVWPFLIVSMIAAFAVKGVFNVEI